MRLLWSIKSKSTSLLGGLRIWLLHLVVLTLLFFIIGSLQGLGDNSLLLILSINRYISLLYLGLTLFYQLLLLGDKRSLSKRLFSLMGFLIVSAIYIFQSGLISWLNGN
jgi:hypothetical protein